MISQNNGTDESVLVEVRCLVSLNQCAEWLVCVGVGVRVCDTGFAVVG